MKKNYIAKAVALIAVIGLIVAALMPLMIFMR